MNTLVCIKAGLVRVVRKASRLKGRTLNPCNQPKVIWETAVSATEYFFIVILSGVRMSSLGTAATIGLLYQPHMIYDGDCGAIDGMQIGRGNRSIRRKPAPVPLCPPQILHDQTRARTRVAAVGNQRLTTWAMAWPCQLLNDECRQTEIWETAVSATEWRIPTDNYTMRNCCVGYWMTNTDRQLYEKLLCQLLNDEYRQTIIWETAVSATEWRITLAFPRLL
jgi:hypothetical protein